MIPDEKTRLLPLTKNETTTEERHQRQRQHPTIFRHLSRQLLIVTAVILVGTVIAITCLVIGYQHSKSSLLTQQQSSSPASSSVFYSSSFDKHRDQQLLIQKWDDWKAAFSSASNSRHQQDDSASEWWKGIGSTRGKDTPTVLKQQRNRNEPSSASEQQQRPKAAEAAEASEEEEEEGAYWSGGGGEDPYHDVIMWMTMQQSRHSHRDEFRSNDEETSSWQKNATFQHLRRFGSLLREWWKSAVHQAQHDEEVLGRDIGEWWNETEHAVDGQNVKKWWNHTEQEAAKDEHALGQNIRGWWNKTEEAAERDEHAIGQHVRGWWNKTEEAAERDEHAMGQNIRGWWNKTEEAAERDEHAMGQNIRKWWNHTEQAAAKDERAVGQWWNRTENAVEQDEERMQHNFQQWWKNSRQKEKTWWNHTVLAFRHFAHSANKREHVWWNMTKHATKDAWNSTREEEERFWHAAQNWFRAHESYATEMNAPLLYLNTSRAYSLLMGDYGWYDYSSDFFLYQSGWDAQINQAYCAVASAATVLNSLRNVVQLPIDPLYDPHPYATQHSVLHTQCVDEHVIHYSESFDGVFHVPGGLSLDQAQGLLECHLPPSFNVTAHHVDPNTTTIEKMKKGLRTALKDPTARVMVNYDRSILDQEGHGHFSPLGSYNKMEDSFLIMDVAKYKYPPAWVTAGRLFASMSTIDACGEWDYPAAQESLRPELLEPNSTHLYHKALKKLHCREDFRGYIIVRRD